MTPTRWIIVGLIVAITLSLLTKGSPMVPRTHW